jgi:hypothetical protein
MTDLLWPDVWHNFFKSADWRKYNIYVHRAAKEFKNSTENDRVPLPLAEFGPKLVPWVETAWCPLFGVEVASLHFALHDDIDNMQFVFVSDSTVPLKNFRYVYNQLVRTQTTSKFCPATRATHDTLWQEAVRMEATKGCIFRDWLQKQNPRTVKHHQWLVLARQHALAVVRHALAGIDTYEKSWLYAAPDVDKMGEGCSDEGAPITTLLKAIELEKHRVGRETDDDLAEMGVEKNCLTFIWWRGCFKGSKLEMPEPNAITELFRSGESQRLYNSISIKRKSPSNLLPSVSMNYDFLASPLKKQLNGFPHNVEKVSFEYLEELVVSQNFMFARKFNRDVVVQRGGQDTTLDLGEVLVQMWNKIDLRKAPTQVWQHLETVGQPKDSSINGTTWFPMLSRARCSTCRHRATRFIREAGK